MAARHPHIRIILGALGLKLSGLNLKVSARHHVQNGCYLQGQRILDSKIEDVGGCGGWLAKRGLWLKDRVSLRPRASQRRSDMPFTPGVQRYKECGRGTQEGSTKWHWTRCVASVTIVTRHVAVASQKTDLDVVLQSNITYPGAPRHHQSEDVLRLQRHAAGFAARARASSCGTDKEDSCGGGSFILWNATATRRATIVTDATQRVLSHLAYEGEVVARVPWREIRLARWLPAGNDPARRGYLVSPSAQCRVSDRVRLGAQAKA
ncbi:hypothetical protein DFH09DRAFT_1275839 [Mycena vulgaris]|nr:hypothetical protein DFH09DRAFT_1275839 [Mycena vulgaris]